MTRLQALSNRVPFGLVVLFLIVILTPTFLTAQPAHAAICADPPAPANPWNDDFSRILAPPLDEEGNIAATPRPDPFENADTPLYKWYGTNYTFFSYDASCNWGTDFIWSVGASSDSSLFAWATYPFAIAYGVSVIVMGDNWKQALDSAVASVTGILGETMFTALAGIVVTVAGLLAFWAARTGDAPRLFKQLMWVVCLIGVAAISIANPQYLTKTSDTAVTSLVTTAGSVVPDGTDGAAEAGEDEEATAQDKVLRNLDSINRSVYYRAWLQGQLGDADGVAATKYGPQLFKATHLSWWEGRIVQADPEGEGKEILDNKEDAFEEVIANIEDEDPEAFEHIKGQNVNRIGTVISAILQAWLSLPFYIVAMAAVGVALVTLRVVVMILPMLALAGMMEPSRMWMLGVLQRYTRNVVIAPLAFAGALVNITIVGALFRSSLPWAAKVFFAAVIMFVLWGLIKPTVLPGSMGSQGLSMLRKTVAMAAGMKIARAGSQRGGNDRGEQNEGAGPEAPAEAPAGSNSNRSGKAYRPVARAVARPVAEDRSLESARVPESHQLQSATDTTEAQRRVRVERTSGGAIPMGPAAGAGVRPEGGPAPVGGYAPAAGTTDAPHSPQARPAETPVRHPWAQESPGAQWEQRALPPAPAPQDAAPRGNAGPAAVPVVYSPAPVYGEGARPVQEVRSTPAESRVPEQQQRVTGGTTAPEQMPVRDDSTVREPDAVWMPDSARPVAGERDGVSEANLSRNENDEQVFVVWTPEESEGGGRR